MMQARCPCDIMKGVGLSQICVVGEITECLDVCEYIFQSKNDNVKFKKVLVVVLRLASLVARDKMICIRSNNFCQIKLKYFCSF